MINSIQYTQCFYNQYLFFKIFLKIRTLLYIKLQWKKKSLTNELLRTRSPAPLKRVTWCIITIFLEFGYQKIFLHGNTTLFKKITFFSPKQHLWINIFKFVSDYQKYAVCLSFPIGLSICMYLGTSLVRLWAVSCPQDVLHGAANDLRQRFNVQGEPSKLTRHLFPFA